jgi:hypothetical protein
MTAGKWEVHAREVRGGEYVMIEVNASTGKKRERAMNDEERGEFDAWLEEQSRLDREGPGRVE